MKIKNRLALYFTLISATMLLGTLGAIYFTFIKFLESDFYDRLNDRAYITARLYLEADEISSDSLNKVRNQYLETLHNEVVRIYNMSNDAAFIGDDQRYWTSDVINEVRQRKKLKFKEGQRQVVGIFYKDNQGDFVILASAIDQSTLKRTEKLRKIMLVFFFIILSIILLSSRWVANRILRPLDLFIDDVKKIKSNNLDYRVQEGKNKDEIGLLAQDFNNLMEHLEQAFALQKTFVSNASHELRTPITSILMSAEITLSQPRTEEYYKAALTSVIDDIEKMDHIINGLLSLAQSDLEIGTDEQQEIRIDEMLWDLQKEWKRLHDAELILNFSENSQNQEALLIKTNPVLLQIAINNIIANAFKFSDFQSVHCTISASADFINIHIMDQGTGIEPSNYEQIFKPFQSLYTYKEHKGKGLGLYMAHKIILLLKGEISFNSVLGQGTTFSVKLPKF
ncbi:sensor histidine kinase [Pedobacter montanisoli]|uniref:histidine kinase n=1 Tax=Pedobacter montanisoli TaxID=2923277 RepID=A0ABS9ZXH0_9SPHI|nr:HAMP domain-containing sensor histidine kinase [Pedobacter montanisoli]MCJ0743005.1 HAMP domain-containing histidine kinase [Pedobacter montanisoli]